MILVCNLLAPSSLASIFSLFSSSEILLPLASTSRASAITVVQGIFICSANPKASNVLSAGLNKYEPWYKHMNTNKSVSSNKQINTTCCTKGRAGIGVEERCASCLASTTSVSFYLSPSNLKMN
jgi:hypothetical protein